MKDHYAEWAGLSIVCPDWISISDENKKFVNILGDPSSMIQESLVFNVQKCNDELDLSDYPDSICPEEAVLDDYVKDFTVETWTVTEKIFFDKYGKKPIYHNV